MGMYPPDWNSALGEPADTPAPVPRLPDDGEQAQLGSAPALCGMWEIKMWQLDGGSGSLTSVAQWV